MIKIHFFARVRDEIGRSELELVLPDGIDTVGGLTDHIMGLGQSFAAGLSGPRVLVAVNQEMARTETHIQDGDEIAYFPPVTGG